MRVERVREYGSHTIDGLAPSRADLDAVADQDILGRVDLRWLSPGSLEVKASSWVGVVDLDCVRIHIVPKLAGSERHVLRMVDYTYSLPHLRAAPTVGALPNEGASLRDMVCRLLTTECSALLRNGLQRDYRSQEEALPTLRGRFLPERQLTRRHGRLDKLECRYTELHSDVLDNQLCRTALELAGRTAHDPEIRAAARRCAHAFTEHSGTTPLPRGAIRSRLHYHRSNDHYRSAHHWALLLLGEGGFTDLYTRSSAHSETFLLDMNSLFERFVTRLVSDAAQAAGLTINAQASFSTVITDHATKSSFQSIRPDVVLRDSTGLTVRHRPIDAKYKLLADRKISESDLYQAYLYATTVDDPEDVDAAPTCHLIYPGEPSTASKSVAVSHINGVLRARITQLHVDIPMILDAIDTPSYPRVLAEILTSLTSEFQATT